MRYGLSLFSLLLGLSMPSYAETIVVSRMVRAQSVLSEHDITVSPDVVPGSLGRRESVIGMEARVTLHAGRVVMPQDLAPPTLVERNQLIELTFTNGALGIRTEGRSLDRGALGDVIRVMNLGSRNLLSGRVQSDGSVEVGGGRRP